MGLCVHERERGWLTEWAGVAREQAKHHGADLLGHQTGRESFPPRAFTSPSLVPALMSSNAWLRASRSTSLFATPAPRAFAPRCATSIPSTAPLASLLSPLACQTRFSASRLGAWEEAPHSLRPCFFPWERKNRDGVSLGTLNRDGVMHWSLRSCTGSCTKRALVCAH